jgi:hypothetical protein
MIDNNLLSFLYLWYESHDVHLYSIIAYIYQPYDKAENIVVKLFKWVSNYLLT